MKTSLFLFLLACALSSAPAAESCCSTSKAPACCSKELAPARFSDRSIYQLDSIWTTDHRVRVKLAAFKGRPQIVTMFFSTCVSACPLLVNDMKRIESTLPPEIRTNVTFLLVSFDSERDTPQVLAKYRTERQLPANWSLLRGEPDDVQELAALLGVKFKKESNGGFSHSNIITLLNPGGEIVTQQLGLNANPAPMTAAIQQLLSK